jgi:hypothetical protein
MGFRIVQMLLAMKASLSSWPVPLVQEHGARFTEVVVRNHSSGLIENPHREKYALPNPYF